MLRCNQSRVVKYLFKYINKGNDRVTAGFVRSRNTNDDQNTIDEIQQYYYCRYVSTCEAAWRIFGFEIHYKTPPVERLSFHLPSEQTVVFNENESIDSVVNNRKAERTMFLEWMKCNAKYPDARKLRYFEFPGYYVWKKQDREWCPRKKRFALGRLYHAYPGSGERFYMRTLLNFVRGPTCYEDIRTINGVLYPTFKDACYAMGLLDDDKEYIDAIVEASFWASGHYLTSLLVVFLMSNSVSRPEYVWNNTWHLISEDILHKQRKVLQIQKLKLTDDQLKTYVLVEIEKLLINNGYTHQNFSEELCPDSLLIRDNMNKLIAEEMRYDKEEMPIEHEKVLACLTIEQRGIYNEIMSAIDLNCGGVFFLYGHDGTGKTFMWRTLCARIRSQGDIVLPVASSGIAALLLPKGRTAHSRFGIPLVINQDSICKGIQPNSELTALLHRSELIIWNEAPMVSKFCFEALDRSMRDALRGVDGLPSIKPFRGKVVVFGGDFR